MKRIALIFLVQALLLGVVLATTQSAEAAFTFHSGFEMSTTGEWGGITGGPSVQGTTKNTGDYALQCDTTATIAYVDAGIGLSKRGSFYIYVDTIPDDTEIRILGDTTDTNLRILREAPDSVDSNPTAGTWAEEIYGVNWRAQTFTTTAAFTVVAVELKAWKQEGDSPGNLTISIQGTDGSGHPDGSDVCSVTILEANIPISGLTGTRYTFDSGTSLSNTTKYAIVLRAPSGSGGNGVFWKFDNGGNPYANGNVEDSSNSGSSWAAQADEDYHFVTLWTTSEKIYTVKLYQATTEKGASDAGYHDILADDTWGRLSLSCDGSGQNAKVYIDGTEVISEACGATTQFNDQAGVLSSATVDFYFDDIAFDNSDNTTDVGDIRVLRSQPDAAGTYTEFDKETGSATHWENVDECPSSDADFNERDSSSYLRDSYDLEERSVLETAYGEPVSGDILNAVSVWCRMDRSGGGGSTHYLFEYDGGDYETTVSLTTDPVFQNKYRAAPPSGGSWDWDTWDDYEAGASGTGGQDTFIYNTMVMIAYIPAAACSEDISNTPGTWNVNGGTPVATSTDYWSSGSEPNWPLDDGECHFTVTNNSGGAVDIPVKATNFTGGNGWTLTSGSPGEDTVRLRAGKSGDANEGAMVILTTSFQAFIDDLPDSTAIKWELEMETPSSYTDGDEKSSTITISATCS